VKNLNEVPTLERPAFTVAEQEGVRCRHKVSGEPCLERPRGRSANERYAVLSALTRSDEEAAVCAPPILNREPQDVVCPEPAVSENQEHSVADPF
jgi:hypothetical protein